MTDPQPYAGATRALELFAEVLEVNSKTLRTDEVVRHAVASLNLISAVLREFDGSNWSKLAAGLDLAVRSDWSAPVAVRTGEDTAHLTESASVEKLSSDWRTDTWLGYAVLASALYFTCSFSAEVVWPDLTAALRDNMIAALATYGALREWNRRQGR